MIIPISNLERNHFSIIAEQFENELREVIFVSPFLANNLTKLFKDVSSISIERAILVTTFKPNDPEQLTKPSQLKSFFNWVKINLPNATPTIHIDNYLHGKIYIFKGEKEKAIVTSANLTRNGLYQYHEWGVLIENINIINQIESEILEHVDYLHLTEAMVTKMEMFADFYSRNNHEIISGELSKFRSDICDDVYNEARNTDHEPRYWLKPIGVTEKPILKEDQVDFSDLHQHLAFSKKGTGNIRAGDILITVGVGCACILSYFEVIGTPVEATYEEKLEDPDKKRWPWSIEGRCLSQNYGAKWWLYDLNRIQLLQQYIELYPSKPVTKSGGKTLGTLNFGNDKVELTTHFAKYLIEEIKIIESEMS